MYTIINIMRKATSYFADGIVNFFISYRDIEIQNHTFHSLDNKLFGSYCLKSLGIHYQITEIKFKIFQLSTRMHKMFFGHYTSLTLERVLT